MDLEEMQFQNVLYYLESFTFSFEDVEFSIPRPMMLSMNFTKPYDEMIYPLVYANMLVPLWLYQRMVSTTEKIYATLDLRYTLSEETESALIGDSSMVTELSGKFLVVLPANTTIGDAADQLNISKEEGSSNITYEYGEQVGLEICLYNEASHNLAFQKMCGALTNVTLLDIISYIFNNYGVQNALIEKPDNTTVYSPFYFLEEEVTKNILRVVDEYKYHKDGTIVFFDLDCAYICSKKSTCTVWRDNEYKSTYILTLSNFAREYKKFAGVCIDDENKFNSILIPTDAYDAKKLESSPILKNAPQNQFITFTTKNAIMSFFTPNKEFIFTNDDLEANSVNGKYRIRSMEMKLTPMGEFLDPTFTVVLRK